MVKVELEDRTIEAGVRDLIASGDALRPRTAGMSSLRAALGNEVHARYRARREDEHDTAFAAERAVELELDVDGFRVTLSGRIDGLLDRPGTEGPEVEEVKSVIEHGSVDLSSARLQVCTYALALVRAGETRPLTTRVVLIGIADDDERHVPVSFDADATEAKLADLVRGTIVAAERARRLALARAHWAATLAFPHPEVRAQQAQLIEAIEDALVEDRPLVVEAPTGTGKTAAALFGALRFAAARGARVYYATPKTTQQQHVAETFEALCRASAGNELDGSDERDDDTPPPYAVGLHARGRLCTIRGRRCERRTCPRLERYAERAPATVAALALEHRHVSLDALTAAGARDNLCPYELAFDLAARADLVIGDFNYVYDPGIAILSGSPRETFVVIDEAHNLLDRARAYASAQITRADVERAQRAVSPVDPLALPMTAFLADVDRAIETALACVSPEEGMLSHDGHLELPALPPAFDELAARARLLLLRWLARSTPDAGDPLESRELLDDTEPVAELLRTAIRLGSAGHERDAGGTTEPLVPYAIEPRARGGPGVGIVCVDPAPALARRHRRVRGTIAMSGTLAPLDYWSDVLGLQSLDAVPLRVPSPFSPDQRRVVIVPTISTTYRDRRGSVDALANLVADTVALREGPYLVFFPSFAYLSAVRPRLPPVGELLVQTPRSSLAERRALLERFRRTKGTRLLLAVSGGVFGEGIDLPGDELLGAIVVSPCLPPVSFERAAMARAYEATRQAGFAYAMLYPGMQRVVQAAGRVIRREDDRGIVMLIGRRFGRQEILECLPDDWYHYDPSELVPEDPIAALAEFWEG